jgi:hypothetical protein
MAMAEEFVKRMMSDTRLRTFFVLAVAVVGIALRADAGIIAVPPGLAPGSQYRLVFVTANTYTAASSNIADYNTDVNSEANTIAALAALGTTWTVIGSTESVNAITNIGADLGIPIYGLDGNQVAVDAGTDSGGLFGSAPLLAPIGSTENGTIPFPWVWTGAGTSPPPAACTPYCLGDTAPMFGFSGATSSNWYYFDYEGNNQTYSLYAVSGQLTVPSGVPEPTTTVMLTLGGAILIGARRRMVHRNNRATRTLC